MYTRCRTAYQTILSLFINLYIGGMEISPTIANLGVLQTGSFLSGTLLKESLISGRTRLDIFISI